VRVLESFVSGKTGDEQQCEDGIFVSDDFVAVIDGVSDVTGLRYEGLTGGRIAMLTCLASLKNLPRDANAHQAASHLTADLAGRLAVDLTPRQRPAAGITLYSDFHREIWQIGDVEFWHSGLDAGHQRVEKAVDHFASGIRAAILAAELARGVAVERLIHNDVGRDTALELITRQSVFRNNTQAGEWAYGAIDGTAIPENLIQIHPVPQRVDTVVLASDGYPSILPTLAQSERKLANCLAEDPMCIGVLRTTKGIKPGNVSFDDRAYVRIAVR
jgi:hypothetical protein